MSRCTLVAALLLTLQVQAAPPKPVLEEVNALFQAASEGALQGILGYEVRPLVSTDYVNDPRSAIVDAPSTMVVDGTCVKVLAWYDNEIGYVHRMIELAEKIGPALGAAS